MRGGAKLLAALLFYCLFPVVSPAQTQLLRTRDVGFAAIEYENGLTLGATTLYEGLEVQHKRSSTSMNGVLSLFHDGRWSMQGFLEGSAFSETVAASPRFSSLFKSMRGEAWLGAASSAQTGFMPSLQLEGKSRVYFDHDDHGAMVGAALARTFDGHFWQTTVLGEGSAWLRRSSTYLTVRTTPMQLFTGDLLEDTEGAVQWTRGSATYGTSLGIRLGEAQRGTVGWLSFTATFPWRQDLWTSVSIGSYPADLLQSLPGGRYLSVAFRLPNGRIPPLHRRPPPPPPAPRAAELPMNERLAIVFGFALDSANLREIRVWAPGAAKVELMADFVDWIAVPLILQPNGEWQGYYRVPPGVHRFNLRLDGGSIDVPTNVQRAEDEFLGAVGWTIIR